MRTLAIFLFIFFAFVHSKALDNGLAKTPPMGWNSWNTFGCNINEQLIKDVADSIVSKGLKDAGYTYVVIDDCWQSGRNANDTIIADPVRFPSGIKKLADYIHSKGLKFGIYSCAGNLTCAGKPGSLDHEEIDAKTYAKWGVDYLKEDWCNTTGLDAQTQYTKMRDALLSSGRQILFSICEWGQNNPWEWGKNVGNMWRTTTDITACYNCVNGIFLGWAQILDRNANLAPFAGPGYWNDPDMLEVGNSGLTTIESRSHFIMWCMLAAPLIAGNDIRSMNSMIKEILTAPEIIAVDQDSLGIQGTRIKNNNNLQVWQKPLADGSVAVALFNKSDNAATISVSLNDIGFQSDTAYVRDLWLRTNLGIVLDTFKTSVDPHGVIIVKIKGKKENVTSLSLSYDSLTLYAGNHFILNASVVPASTLLKLTSSNDTIIETNIAGVNSYILTGKNKGTCIVKISTLDGALSDSCLVDVKPCNLPSPWKFDDIKDTKGFALYDSTEFTVAGSGNDIWDTRDQFAYINLDTTGNIFISAKLISLQNTDPWAKAGLMIRESGNPGSSFIMLVQTASNGFHLQYRTATAGTCTEVGLTGITLPYYLKLAKFDSTFISYKSADGAKWTKLQTISFKNGFGKNYKIGMCVTAHNNLAINTSKFSDVELGITENPHLEICSNSSSRFSIHPNPVSDFLTVLAKENNVLYEITNLNGQILLGGVLTSNNNTIDCTRLSNGIYNLKIIGHSIAENKMFFKIK
jgi:alpha-galactosidase